MIDKDADQIADSGSSESMADRSNGAWKDGEDDRRIIGQDEFPSPAPVFTEIPEICDKPSSRRSRASVCHTKLLHNDVAQHPSNPHKSSENRHLER